MVLNILFDCSIFAYLSMSHLSIQLYSWAELDEFGTIGMSGNGFKIVIKFGTEVFVINFTFFYYFLCNS